MLKDAFKNHFTELNFGVMGYLSAEIIYTGSYHDALIESVIVSFDGENEVNVLSALDEMEVQRIKEMITNHEVDLSDRAFENWRENQ